MNPFEFRSLFLARHAQHVVLIHFPIALFLVGVFFDLLSRGREGSRFATVAEVNLSVAAISSYPAFITGLLAWRFALDGQNMHGTLLYHFLAACLTTLLITTSWWLHSHSRGRRYIAIIVELAGVIAVALTAHLGGFLSGVNT